MKSRIVLENLRYGTSYAVCDDPEQTCYNAEAKVTVTDGKGRRKTRYIVLSRFCGTTACFETSRSILDQLNKMDERAMGLELGDATNDAELNKLLARNQFKKAYELLFDIVERDCEDLREADLPQLPVDLAEVETAPIPVEDDVYSA